jgi:hypothetical protein
MDCLGWDRAIFPQSSWVEAGAADGGHQQLADAGGLARHASGAPGCATEPALPALRQAVPWGQPVGVTGTLPGDAAWGAGVAVVQAAEAAAGAGRWAGLLPLGLLARTLSGVVV